jgi:hypothetical protein
MSDTSSWFLLKFVTKLTYSKHGCGLIASTAIASCVKYFLFIFIMKSCSKHTIKIEQCNSVSIATSECNNKKEDYRMMIAGIRETCMQQQAFWWALGMKMLTVTMAAQWIYATDSVHYMIRREDVVFPVTLPCILPSLASRLMAWFVLIHLCGKMS